jgi:leucyl aminopeptidase (aminopeptidase T)
MPGTTERAIIKSLSKFFLQNAAIKPDNKLLIIADKNTDPRVYGYLGKAAQLYIPSGNIAVFIFDKAENFRYQFTPGIVNLLKEADIIISPTTISIYHAKELQQALTPAKKFFSMTGATIETLYKYGAKADFKSISKTASALKDLITGCARINVFSKAGTHFSAVIEGRNANMETSIGQFGKSATFPDIEVNTSIIEDSGEGKIIIDGAATGFGVFQNQVEFIVNKGKIVSIKGGKEAAAVKKLLDKTDDPNMYQIAEIGMGLNPFSKIYGVIIEDEAAYGTSHFGIGQNIFMGGVNKATTHLDFVLKNPQIFLDGNELLLKKDAVYYNGKSVGRLYR